MEPTDSQVHVPGQTRINRLRNLRLKRIDLVDQGASQDLRTGQGARVLLYKRMESCIEPCRACAVGIPTAAQDNVASYVATLTDGRQVLQSVVPPVAINMVDFYKATAAAIDAPATVPVICNISKFVDIDRTHQVEVRAALSATELPIHLVSPTRESDSASLAVHKNFAAIAPGLVDLLPAGRARGRAELGDIQAIRLHGELIPAIHTCKHGFSDSGIAKEYIALSTWTTAQINDLPDSSFAYIAPGGEKDEEGRTTPRSLRHLPYKGPDGKPDASHVRNALARLSQTDIPQAAQASARRKLQTAAGSVGVETADAEKAANGNGKKPFPGAAPLFKMLGAMAEKLGITPADIAKQEDNGNGVTTFEQAQMHHDKDELFEDLYQDMASLCEAVCSAVDEGTTDDIRAAVDAFIEDVKEDFAEFLSGEFEKRAVTKRGRKISAARMKMLKHMMTQLGDFISEAEGDGNEGNAEDQARAGEYPKPSKGVGKMVEKATETVDIQKRIEEEVAKALATHEAEKVALAKRLETAEGRLVEEVTIRKREEYIKKAAIFKSLPIKADDDYKIFQEVDDKLSPDVAKRVMELLKAADEGMRQSGLFKSIGSGGAASGQTAWEQIEAQADAMVAKGAGMTKGQAVEMVLRQNPDLYARHTEEQRANGRIV